MQPTTTGTPSTPPRPVLCIGHRGASAHAPENTLQAFALAFDLGADAIECDVQRSRDGHLVVLHDGTLGRTTDGRGALAAASLAELRLLDAAGATRRGRHIFQQIPTLDETLALVRQRGGGINIEVKGESEAEALETAQTLATTLATLDAAMRQCVLVSSFTHSTLAQLKEALPWLCIATLFGGDSWRRRDMLAVTQQLGAEALHPGLSLVSGKLVRRAHDAGLRVNVFTVNRRATIRRLLQLGVDGIITDYPERVVIARATTPAPEPDAGDA